MRAALADVASGVVRRARSRWQARFGEVPAVEPLADVVWRDPERARDRLARIRAGSESAAPVVVHDIDGDDDGAPGALVAVAVAAVAASGIGAGVLGRSPARRPGRP